MSGLAKLCHSDKTYQYMSEWVSHDDNYSKKRVKDSSLASSGEKESGFKHKDDGNLVVKREQST